MSQIVDLSRGKFHKRRKLPAWLFLDLLQKRTQLLVTVNLHVAHVHDQQPILVDHTLHLAVVPIVCCNPQRLMLVVVRPKHSCQHAADPYRHCAHGYYHVAVVS